MNKKLQETFSQCGITFDKRKGYGVVHGFETNVLYSNINPIVMHFSCYVADELKQNILQALAAEKMKFTQFAFDKFGLGLAINDWTAGTLAKRLVAVLTKICEILTSNGALGIGYCPVCGNALDFEHCKKCLIGDMSISIDNTCVDCINVQIDADNKTIDNAPNNYLRGFAGAFIGGLAGAAISVLFYVAGIISAVSAFIAFFVGELLYRKFGGKPNAVMVVGLTCTVFAMMILSIVGTYFVTAAIYADEAGVSAMEYFKWCMEDPEIRRSFVADLALTVLFTIVGCAYEIYMLCKRIKRQDHI